MKRCLPWSSEDMPQGTPGLGVAVAGFPGEAQSTLVSRSFMEVLSFIDDILVKLLWLG